MYVYSLTFLTFLFHERTSKLIKHYRESRIDEATYPTNVTLLRFSHYLTTRSIWLATKRLLIWILSNDEMTKFAIIENYLRTRAKHNRTETRKFTRNFRKLRKPPNATCTCNLSFSLSVARACRASRASRFYTYWLVVTSISIERLDGTNWFDPRFRSKRLIVGDSPLSNLLLGNWNRNERKRF